MCTACVRACMWVCGCMVCARTRVFAITRPRVWLCFGVRRNAAREYADDKKAFDAAVKVRPSASADWRLTQRTPSV